MINEKMNPKKKKKNHEKVENGTNSFVLNEENWFSYEVVYAC